MKRKIELPDEYRPLYLMKDFGHGYIFDEMATIQGFDLFINKSNKDFDPESDDIMEREGWDAFEKFLKVVLEYHKDTSGLDTFIEIVNQDKITQKIYWDKMQKEGRQKITKLAQRLDEKNSF